MRILVVDDDEILRLAVRLSLESFGHLVEEATNGFQALRMVEANPDFDVLLLDVNMPQMNGIEALQKIKEMNPQIFCLVLTAYSDVKDAVKAIKYGAYDYVEKPVDSEQILSLIDQAKEANSLVQKVALSAPEVKFSEHKTMIGGSNEIRRVFDIIYKLAKVDTPVLIRGESGTGKELVARALHSNSHRKKGPFVAVNCGAIPDTLIESEFFGYVKGAFTGADKRKIGKFEFAEGGTLFLDEIGDISRSMQVKFLRVLQEKVFSPIGSHDDIKIDVRIIAATNKPLEEMVEKGDFRADFFYRLNILPILLPPLRSRREDIVSLTKFMIQKFNKEHDRQVRDIDPEALETLMFYDWPGNIRELENVIEHAFILENSEVLTVASLPRHLVVTKESPKHELYEKTVDLKKTDTSSPGSSSSLLDYPALKEQFEKEFIVKALKAYHGRINQTAAHTKMTKVTLLRKLEKYGINPREYYLN